MLDIIKELAMSGRVLPVAEHGVVSIPPGASATVIDFDVPTDYALGIRVMSETSFIRSDIFINDRIAVRGLGDFLALGLEWWFPPTYNIRVEGVNLTASNRSSNIFFFGNFYPLLDFDFEIEKQIAESRRMAA